MMKDDRFREEGACNHGGPRKENEDTERARVSVPEGLLAYNAICKNKGLKLQNVNVFGI